MFKRYCFALLALWVFAAVAGAQPKPGQKTEIEPAAFDNKLDVQISGKHRDYYVLEPGKTMDVALKGPGELRVYSRVLLAATSDTVSYTFLARRGAAKKAAEYSFSAEYSDKASVTNQPGMFVGESRLKSFNVPRGEQTFTFSLPQTAIRPVLLRFIMETTVFAKGAKIVSMTPSEFSTPVELVYKEEANLYYRIGTGHKAVLRLIGPATLKVLSRVEFDSKMNGRQKWKVQVLEDGKVKATYSLRAKKSQVTTYKSPAELVPSRGETFYVEIPHGEHTYEFVLPDNHRTSLLRFLMPENDLKRK